MIGIQPGYVFKFGTATQCYAAVVMLYLPDSSCHEQ